MKKSLRIVILAIGFLLQLTVVFGTLGALFLGAFGQIRPGNPLFPLQLAGEQAIYRFSVSRTAKADLALGHALRRTHDLAALKGTPHEIDAVVFLNASLDQALGTLKRGKPIESTGFNDRLIDFAVRAGFTIDYQSTLSVRYLDTYKSLTEKLATLKIVIAGQKVREVDPVRIIGLELPFPTESEPAVRLARWFMGKPSADETHSIFPLAGKHAIQDCESCHGTLMANTLSAECSSCHTPTQPDTHFKGECRTCHTEFSWRIINFKHPPASTSGCQSCHDGQKPESHYAEQCERCHTTSTWTAAKPDHTQIPVADCTDCHVQIPPPNHSTQLCTQCHTAGAVDVIKIFGHTSGSEDCQVCHTDQKPADHFPQPCGSCHKVSGWGDLANLDHSKLGIDDCLACHSDDRPPDHFPGQCSQCHRPTSGWAAAIVNHTGLTDCIACHRSDRPAGLHPDGQCSLCHQTTSWSGARMNHTGFPACQSCHSSDRPANHFPGECSTCHSTTSWAGAQVNHNLLEDCQACHTRPVGHFTGQCSSCHNTNAWRPASINHSGLTDCQACHTRPAGHFTGQCSSCHNTNAWRPASVNHSVLTDCQSCHSRPANHLDGQCSQCHSPAGWSRPHGFPINHKNAGGECRACHTGGTAEWTCFGCHDQGETNDHHKEVNGYTPTCTTCHPTGNKD